MWPTDNLRELHHLNLLLYIDSGQHCIASRLKHSEIKIASVLTHSDVHMVFYLSLSQTSQKTSSSSKNLCMINIHPAHFYKVSAPIVPFTRTQICMCRHGPRAFGVYIRVIALCFIVQSSFFCWRVIFASLFSSNCFR